MDRAYIEGVQRRVLIRIDEKLQKWLSLKNIRLRIQAVSSKVNIRAF